MTAHEPVTTELVASLMRDLTAAFDKKFTPQQIVHKAEIYRDHLSGLSGESLRFAVKSSIQEDQYFPKIARLRELATRWTVHNAPPALSINSERHCRCGAWWELVTRYRPRVEARKIVIDGEWMLLEAVQRSMCPACDPPSACQPNPAAPFAPPIIAMLIADAPVMTMKRIADETRTASRAARAAAPVLPSPKVCANCGRSRREHWGRDGNWTGDCREWVPIPAVVTPASAPAATTTTTTEVHEFDESQAAVSDA